MDPFLLANRFTKKWEGGYVNHRDDPGGPTNFGVSLRWLKDLGKEGDIDRDGDVDIEDILALGPEQAESLFREKFWDAHRLSDLPPLVGIVLYDTFINCGPSQGAKFAQRLCNAWGIAPELTVDGIVGERTRLHIKAACASKPGSEIDFARKLVLARRRFHEELGKQTRFKAFLAGWCNRDDALAKYVDEIASA